MVARVAGEVRSARSAADVLMSAVCQAPAALGAARIARP
jgi:hypothetical protein